VLLPGIAGELPNKKLLCGLIGRLFFNSGLSCMETCEMSTVFLSSNCRNLK